MGNYFIGRRIAATFIAVLAGFTSVVVAAGPADAAPPIDGRRIYHTRDSEYGAVRAYAGYNGTGSSQLVARGKWSNGSISSFLIGDGASLWRYRTSIDPKATRWFRVCYNPAGGAKTILCNTGQWWESEYSSRRGANLGAG